MSHTSVCLVRQVEEPIPQETNPIKTRKFLTHWAQILIEVAYPIQLYSLSQSLARLTGVQSETHDAVLRCIWLYSKTNDLVTGSTIACDALLKVGGRLFRSDAAVVRVWFGGCCESPEAMHNATVVCLETPLRRQHSQRQPALSVA
jgi:hypothetical protein